MNRARKGINLRFLLLSQLLSGRFPDRMWYHFFFCCPCLPVQIIQPNFFYGRWHGQEVRKKSPQWDFPHIKATCQRFLFYFWLRLGFKRCIARSTMTLLLIQYALACSYMKINNLPRNNRRKFTIKCIYCNVRINALAFFFCLLWTIEVSHWWQRCINKLFLQMECFQLLIGDGLL